MKSHKQPPIPCTPNVTLELAATNPNVKVVAVETPHPPCVEVLDKL